MSIHNGTEVGDKPRTRKLRLRKPKEIEFNSFPYVIRNIPNNSTMAVTAIVKGASIPENPDAVEDGLNEKTTNTSVSVGN